MLYCINIEWREYVWCQLFPALCSLGTVSCYRLPQISKLIWQSPHDCITASCRFNMGWISSPLPEFKVYSCQTMFIPAFILFHILCIVFLVFLLKSMVCLSACDCVEHGMGRDGWAMVSLTDWSQRICLCLQGQTRNHSCQQLPSGLSWPLTRLLGWCSVVIYPILPSELRHHSKGHSQQLKLTSREISSPHTITSSFFPSPSQQAPT